MNEELKKPIQPHQVEWRVARANGGTLTVVPYITSRTVMDRFDAAFGAHAWQNTFERWGDKGGVKCGISVLCGDEWVTKFDGADETTIEPTKGGFSDSMKRAAAQWGLARDLYEYPTVYIETPDKYIPSWAYDRLSSMVTAFIEGKLEGMDAITIKQPKK